MTAAPQSPHAILFAVSAMMKNSGRASFRPMARAFSFMIKASQSPAVNTAIADISGIFKPATWCIAAPSTRADVR